MNRKTTKIQSINLALQGGGSHGAFTWGVLDYLLEQEQVHLEALSGTSAGAVNAALLISGYQIEGREGAKQALENFWRAISRSGFSNLLDHSDSHLMKNKWSLDDSPFFLWFDVISRVASPYQFNPLNLNPLKAILNSHIDFKQLGCCSDIKIFVSATNVETGQVKIFRNDEITVDVILASACLPMLFQAVEIDDTPYWDGGFMGNPVLHPFYYECDSRDVVIVKINPLYRPGTPKTARDILNRMDEINFNSSLLKDLRAIHFVKRLLKQHKIEDDEYKDMLIHIVDGDECLVPLSASSKFNTEWEFIKYLHDTGRRTAQQWFKANRRHIGKKSSFDLDELFQ